MSGTTVFMYPIGYNFIRAFMIRQKVSSDKDLLEELHLKYAWIPGAQSIRPTPETTERKEHYIKNMLERYRNLDDFVLHKFFGLKSTSRGGWNESRLCVLDSEMDSARVEIAKSGKQHEYRFVPNLFTYQVPNGTNHYVIWFILNGNETIDPVSQAPITDDEINRSIEQGIRQTLGSSNENTFSFVWYLNPKQTMPSHVLYHVQVFWIP